MIITMILFSASYAWVGAEMITVPAYPFPGRLFGAFGTLTLCAGVLLAASIAWLYISPTWTLNKLIAAEKDEKKQSKLIAYKYVTLWGYVSVFKDYFWTSEAVFGYANPNIKRGKTDIPLAAYGNAVMGVISGIYVDPLWILAYCMWWFPMTCMVYFDTFKAITATLICAGIPALLTLMSHSSYTFLSYHFAAVFFFYVFVYLLEIFVPPVANVDDPVQGWLTTVDYNFMTTLPSVNGTSTQATTVTVSYWIAFVLAAFAFGSSVKAAPVKDVGIEI
jgi:hypothetical protein